MKYNGDIYTTKDAPSEDAKKFQDYLENGMTDINRITLELEGGEILVVGKGVIQNAVFLLVP